MSEYQPKTGRACHCRKGVQRDNCPDCEGTGQQINFKAIRERNKPAQHTPGPWQVVWTRKPYGIKPVSGEVLGHVFRSHVNGHEGQQEANARLIAAAPDMKICLTRIYQFVEARMLENPQDAKIQAYFGTVSRWTKSELDKAEGRA